MPGSPETTWILPAFLAPHRTPPAHASLNPANRLPCRSPFGEYLTRFSLQALDQNARCSKRLFGECVPADDAAGLEDDFFGGPLEGPEGGHLHVFAVAIDES